MLIFGYMAVSLLKGNCLKPPKETSKHTEHFHQLLGWILSKSKSCLLLQISPMLPTPALINCNFAPQIISVNITQTTTANCKYPTHL